MKHKLYNLLIKNWHWKVLALIAACLFWYAYVNIQNPVATETVSAVPVKVLHYEEFLAKGKNVDFMDSALDINNLSLNVTVRGRTTLVQQMAEQKDKVFNIWIDLYELESNDDRLIIHYEIAPGYRYLFSNVQFSSLYNQTYYEVAVEEDVSKTIPLEYQIVGSPAEGYTYIEDDPSMMLTPTEITVYGPETELADISSAQILASIEGLKANSALAEPIMFYDADGNRTYLSNNVTTSSDAATLYIPIYQTKSVPLKASLVGEPQEGYQYMNDAKLSVDSVVIYGQESDLKDINQLVLPDISLSEYTGKASEVFSLSDILASRYPNNDVRYYSGSTSVRVSFTVEELIRKDLELNTSDIKIKGMGDRTIKFKSKTVTLTVEGVQQALDDIKLSAVHMEINLEGLESGEHTVPISVYIMSTKIGQIPVTILDEENFTTTVIIEEPVQEEEPEEEESSEGSSEESEEKSSKKSKKK